MVMGASGAGARAITTSSSPGISLKQEGISYIAGAELPAVIVNVMRAGPGLGNIWPAQSDYFQATKGGGHGDYRNIVLAPSGVQEAFDLTILGFDLADKYRNPVMILADGMFGQMMEPIETYNPKIKDYKKSWALTGCKGRTPNLVASFRMREGEMEKHNIHLKEKYEEIMKNEQRYELYHTDDAKVVIVAYGTMARIVKGAIKNLRRENLQVGLLRPITLWPYPQAGFKEIEKRKTEVKFLVVEMSSGQMVEDVKLALSEKYEVYFYGRTGGGIPREEEIIERVKNLLN
jgi:2-oxoglutarate ferredoxin oxidoreductase subunit alpha